MFTQVIYKFVIQPHCVLMFCSSFVFAVQPKHANGNLLQNLYITLHTQKRTHKTL